MTFYNEFAQHYDTIFPFRPAVKEFLQRNLPDRGQALDIGCGPGRYCAALGTPDRLVVGADLDKAMVARARELFPGNRFEPLGMEDLDKLEGGKFTGAYCVGNVLPHLSSGRLPGMLAGLKRLLSKDGRWIIQTVNFDPILEKAEHPFPPLEFPDQGLVFHRTYKSITTDRLDFHTRLEREGQTVFSGSVSLCPRTSDRLLEKHKEAGFRLLGHYGDFQEREFGPDSPAGIMVFAR